MEGLVSVMWLIGDTRHPSSEVCWTSSGSFTVFDFDTDALQLSIERSSIVSLEAELGLKTRPFLLTNFIGVGLDELVEVLGESTL